MAPDVSANTDTYAIFISAANFLSNGARIDENGKLSMPETTATNPAPNPGDNGQGALRRGIVEFDAAALKARALL